MPAVATQPSLHKPKSKIRLRLGLTPPHPKPAPSKPDPMPIISADSSLQASAASHTSTSTTDPIHDPAYSSLNDSTNTFSSQQSRADSRDAFAYDHDNSPESANVAPSPAFDVISYATTSPVSAHHDAPSSKETISPTQIQTEDTLHPHITAATASEDVFSLTDEQLSDRFMFISEIGFGNWGSVWMCKPKHARASMLHTDMGKLGKTAAAGGGSGAGGKVAIKLVHRSKTPTTATRVRALWGEMKIIRSLRHEPHPSIIQFEAFVITPSYALVVMPHLATLIPVCLPPSRATPYFRQLASAVGYLHERGITHNDIKPANVLLSHNDIPVLVDFGFAQKWEVGERGSFLSSISWGTPEYLDPQRAKGMPHDERASDVWSLGITMFEILIGRTPFEANDDEQFSTPEELHIYYERTRKGIWVGEWSMPSDLRALLRAMICPDPAYRITAMQAYHHPALLPSAPSVIITPHFVRAAASFDNIEDEPLPTPPANVEGAKTGKKRRQKKKDVRDQSHASTPTALGESIKQHTSVTRPKAVKGDEKTPSPKKGSMMVIRKTRDENMLGGPKEEGKESHEPTPTKMVKPAQLLLVKQNAATVQTILPRASSAQLNTLSRPVSTELLTSSISDPSTTPAAKTKEEAVLKTMRSLEGIRSLAHVEKSKQNQRDVLSNIKRAAPEPPLPKSLDSAEDAEKESKDKKMDQRRSLGLDQVALVEVTEENVHVKVAPPGNVAVIFDAADAYSVDVEASITSPQQNAVTAPPAVPMSPARASSIAIPPEASPAKPRLAATRPTDIVIEGKQFPGTDPNSPLAELTQKILISDQEKLVRFRQISGDLVASARASVHSSRMAKTSLPAGQASETAVPAMTRTRSVEALALEGRLDQIAHWVKDVERIVEDARKALAEGRQPPLPIPGLPSGSLSNDIHLEEPITIPDKEDSAASAIPEHIRALSTQAEPATPPKWMTFAEAEETVKKANEWIEQNGSKEKVKKERPTGSGMFKLFGSDKEEQLASRTDTPEPSIVPLKAPQLRGVPSTPALRSSNRSSILGLTRKSESNLRNSKLFPNGRTPTETAETTISPRRAVYEDLLGSEPGVIRQGDGWSSLSSGRAMGKPTSMASLRERAIAFLRDDHAPKQPMTSPTAGTSRNIVDLAAEVQTKRPDTPGAASVLTMGKPTSDALAKKKGFIGRLKGMVGGKGKLAEGA